METLAERIARTGKLEGTDAVALAARLALRVERMHARGEQHGAISPRAILLGESKGASLKSVGDSPAVPSYLSPERVRGSERSEADDVWAIGAVLYISLTGHAAFAGATIDKVAERMQSGPVAPIAVFDAGDDDLAGILERLLAIDKSSRITTASEAKAELEWWLGKRGLAVGPMMDLVSDEPSIQVDLASIPPPPRLPGVRDAEIPKAPKSPFAEMLDEDTTLPRDEATEPTVPRAKAKPPVSTPARAESAPLGSSPPARAKRLELPSTPELLARARTATSAPPPRLNPPLAARKISTRPPPLGGGEGKARVLPSAPPPFPSAPPPMRSGPPPLPSTPPAESAPPARSEPPPILPLPSTPPEGEPSSLEVPSLGSPRARRSLDVAQSVRASAGATNARTAKPRGSVLPIILGAAALVVGGYAIYRVVGGSEEPSPAASPKAASSEPPPSSSAPSTSAPSASVASAPTSPVVPSSPVPTASSVEPAPSASTALSSPAAPEDQAQCFSSLLAADSIAEGKHLDLAFVCKEADPRKASSKVRSKVIFAAGGHVSDAMREWSMLGFYELATYAAMRGRCCPGARPLELPPSPGSCPSIQDALNAISAAAHKGATEAEQSSALDGFRTAVLCIEKSGQAASFGDYPPLAGGQDTAFMKTFQRTRN